MDAMKLKAVVALAVLAGLSFGGEARAQFSQTPSNLPAFQQPQGPINRSRLTQDQIERIMLLRYLQGRSSGGVRTGVPQFVPLGSLGYGNYPGMNMQRYYQQQRAMQNNAAGGQGLQNNRGFQNGQNFQNAAGQQAAGGQAGQAPDPQAQQQRMTPAERRAEAEAARQERKREARERAEKRRAEAAEKIRARAEERKRQAALLNGDADPAN